MNIYKLPLVDYLNDDTAIQLIFLDKDSHMVHVVKWNKRKFNSSKQVWEDDEEKLHQVESWCKEYLGTPIDDINSIINQEFQVYSYDTFDSLWEVPAKFDKDLQGQFIQADIEKVVETPTCIEIWYRYENDLYLSRMRYEYRIEDNVYTDVVKKNKRFETFKEKFGVSVEDAVNGAINGRTINVLIKTFGKNIFGDIQSIVKPKK